MDKVRLNSELRIQIGTIFLRFFVCHKTLESKNFS